MKGRNPMGRMKTLCMALFAVLALAIAFTTTASAALPDVHLAKGEKYPVTGEGSVGTGAKVVGTLETEIGEKLTATKVTAVAELTALSSLGPGKLTFTGVTEKNGHLCNTVGQVEGEVLFGGEYHVVYTVLSPLTAGVLILFNELTVECNAKKLKIKVKAPALTKLNVAAGAEVSEYKLETACTKGKQEPREYYSDEEKLTVANLLANFGLGFEKACYVGEPLTLKSGQPLDFLF
jgi:hypothetical protein